MDAHFLTSEDFLTIKNSLLCRGMEQPAIDEILADGSVKSLTKSEYLFEQGQAADRLYLVLSGWVQIERTEGDGSNVLISVFDKGESLAEAAAFLAKPYPVSARAMTETRVFGISGTRLMALLQRDQDVLAAALASLYKKLHDLVNEVEVLKSRTIRERLALFLLENLTVDEGPVEIRLPFGKALIAARIGTSPEQLSRTFRDMRSFGVKVAGQTASIEDPNALREMLKRT